MTGIKFEAGTGHDVGGESPVAAYRFFINNASSE